MKRIITSIMLCVALTAWSLCTFAYSYVPYVGDGIVSSTPISVRFYDADEKEVQDLADAVTIKAGCKVKPGGEFDAPVTVSIIIAAYKDKAYADCAFSSAAKFETSEDGSKYIDAVFDNSTAKADGIKIYLWNNVDSARPLFSMGELSSSSGIEAVIIGGEKVKIDETTCTGSVKVNAGYTEWPEVMAITDNTLLDVSVDVKGNFPLSKNSHIHINSNVEAPGESETGYVEITAGDKTYNISVTQAVPQITDVKFKEFAKDMTADKYYSDAKAKIQYAVSNPVWTAALPDPNVDNSGFKPGTKNVSEEYRQQFKEAAETLENISYVYSDRTDTHSTMTFFYFNIAPELLGSNTFTLPYPTAGVTSSETENCFEFTIDRSARVYMQNGADLSKRGWTRASNLVGTQTNTKNIMYYEFWTNTAGGVVYATNGNYLFYKDYAVEPGTICPISLPAGTKSPRIFVQYKNTDLVKNPVYTKNGVKTGVKTTSIYKPVYKDAELADSEGKYAMLEYPNGAASTSDITIPSNAKGNILFATSVFTDSSTPTPERQGLVLIPDELEGASVLRLPSVMTDIDTVEFDLSASSRVYLFTNVSDSASVLNAFETAIGEGWENTEFDYTGVGEGENAVAVAYRISATAFSGTILNKSSFYRDYVIMPGETEHIKINLDKSLSGKKVIVVIKQLSE